MRWGFPPAGGGKRPVTNVRSLQSNYWGGWLDDRPPATPEAMPVMLTGDEIDTWLEAPIEEAAALVRPYPPEKMKIVLSCPLRTSLPRERPAPDC